MISDKPIESITKDDVLELITNKVRESASLDFKAKLHGNSDKEKKEFLADISSFANYRGGLIVYGIKDNDQGEAEELCLLQDFNQDRDLLAIESLIRDGLTPKLFTCQLRALEIDDGLIFLIKIGESWTGPHMVSFKQSARFFLRKGSSPGKHQMDYEEIKRAFSFGIEYKERLEMWRNQRIAKIIGNEGPVRLRDEPKLIIHLIPFSSLSGESIFEPINYDHHNLTQWLTPPLSSGGYFRYNLDGVLIYSHDNGEGSRGYSQVFRTGRMEFVATDIVREIDNRSILASVYYEKEIIQSLNNYRSRFASLGINFPVIFMMTIVGAEGSYMGVGQSFWMEDKVPLDRNVAHYPEIVLENNDEEIHLSLKPVFDAVWNSYGYSKSFNYNDQNEWVGHR